MTTLSNNERNIDFIHDGEHLYFEAINIESADVYLLNVYPMVRDMKGNKHIIDTPVHSEYRLYDEGGSDGCWGELFEFIEKFECIPTNHGGDHLYFDDQLMGFVKDETEDHPAMVSLQMPRNIVKYTIKKFNSDGKTELVRDVSSELRFATSIVAEKNA